MMAADSPTQADSSGGLDPAVAKLIASARRAQQTITPQRSGSGRMAAVLSILGGLLAWASFAPLEMAPLAWLSPVPWLCLVRLERPTRRMSLAAYLGGVAYFLPAFQWMRLGDPTMYLAWWALAFYLAAYIPLGIGLMRIAVHRLHVPLVVTAPVVWVGLEYLRAHLFTGVAWYLLGHSQYRWLELIQISDLVGGYGVSFVMLASAAAIAGWIPTAWFLRSGLAVMPETPADDPNGAPITERPAHPLDGVTPSAAWPIAVASLLVLVTLGYGVVRRSQAAFTPGPRVALIQGNFPASLRIPDRDFVPQYVTHMKLTGLAVREQPDLIVWPESMFRWPLASAPAEWTDEELQQRAPRVPPHFWRDPEVRETLSNEAQKTNAAMLFGLEAVELTETGLKQANAAQFVHPETGLGPRYDKRHLVPFGEYIPFKKQAPWLAAFTPYPADFGLTPGEHAVVCEYKQWRMTPVICFEDTVPHLVRGLVAAAEADGKPLDLLVNLSNDGWFHGSSGLDQHLITAAFRAVECRTPLVRAVNTGISAVVDGDGAIREPELFIDGETQRPTSYRDPQTGRWKRQLNAAVIQTVPLDHRSSFYVRTGDWFAMTCAASALFAALWSIWTRRQTRT